MSQPDHRALVLTALPVEYAAVRAHLGDLREEEDAVGTVYEVGNLETDESRWTVILAEVGAGNVRAATQVERALLHFRPSVAFFIGVAGGVKDVAIGDVVAATKVYGYESGKDTASGFRPRPDVGLSAYRLVQRARAEARKGDWNGTLASANQLPAPRAFVGPIAAGEKVVASAESETASFLREHYGDALAIEMEGVGFLGALHAHVDTAALVVRGISDLLSGKSDADRSGSQELASKNAAAFAMAIMARLGEAAGAYELPPPDQRKRVFIAYSHDSTEHMNIVRGLAQQLRADGVDCWIDAFEREPPPTGWPLWMEQQLSTADVVVVVCTEPFSRRFSGEDSFDVGLGTAWESQLTSQMLAIGEPARFMPVLFEGANLRDVPFDLRSLPAARLPAEYDQLLLRLTEEPAVSPKVEQPKEFRSVQPPSSDRRQIGQPPARVFVSYSHRDERFREELGKHLAVLRRQGILELWSDRKISPGADWKGEIDDALTDVDIVLLLVSADFLASDYCYDREMVQALDRHRSGHTRVVPVILRPCDWSSAPIGSLQALPRDARPVSAWANADDAWLDVARALRTLATRDTESQSPTPSDDRAREEAHQPPPIRPIEALFPRGGVPQFNYVTPHRFNYLKVYLRDPCGGVVVEGPSGVGKTTATRKALDELGVEEGSSRWFSAGRPKDVESFHRVLESPPDGVVVIDDFHYLSPEMKTHTAQAIKYASDRRDGPATKYVLIGINKVGYALLDSFPDLHGRVVTFSMGRQPDEKIEELISLGEAAANIRFVRKADIALEASGSFFMAQQLCFFVAMAAGVEQTQDTLTEVKESVADVTPDILEYQRLKFHKPVTEFASFDRGAAQRGACLALLHKIAFDGDGCVLIEDVRRQYPDLDASFAWLNGDNGPPHHQASTLLAGLFHFDASAGVFSVEDPQVQFYMKHLEWSAIAKQTGVRAKVTPDGWLHIGSG